MIVVTGAAGFIGSCLIRKLNDESFNDIIAVDNFSNPQKPGNLKSKKLRHLIDRTGFFTWLDRNAEEVEFIFHLGARTDTTETNRELLWSLNTDYSKSIWTRCCQHQIPLIYASSAATYGKGEHGFSDEESLIEKLAPLNAYAESKQAFDLWAINQKDQPFFWAGLKFFNVYGPNEYHKGRMASMVFQAIQQVRETGKVKLFRSHHPEFADGEQLRDFVYVKDVIEVLYWLMHHRKDSGIYNVGSAIASTFYQLTECVFRSMNKEEVIEYVEIPPDIRTNYQYFTKANIEKLQSIGGPAHFVSLAQGIPDYLNNYLISQSYF